MTHTTALSLVMRPSTMQRYLKFPRSNDTMFRGSIVAIVTPMGACGTVDFDSLGRLVEFHIGNGASALVVAGTTGESSTLTMEEHGQVIRAVVDQCRNRIAVIAGTGSNCTREAIDITQYAREVGAEACLLVTPYYNKPTQEGLFQHFKACAEAVAIPQILYNVPGRTAVDLLPETIERLSHIPNIIGIKEATGKLDRIVEILQRCGERIKVYSGDDATAREAMLLGAVGDISVTANVAPALMKEMCDLAVAHDSVGAAAIDAKLAALHKDLFVEANPIPVKWALYDMGLIPPGIRLPLTMLSPHHHETIRSALRMAGLT